MATRRYRDPQKQRLYAALRALDPERGGRVLNDAYFYGKSNPGKPRPPIYGAGMLQVAWRAGVDQARSQRKTSVSSGPADPPATGSP